MFLEMERKEFDELPLSKSLQARAWKQVGSSSSSVGAAETIDTLFP